jgi:outer membrane protein OmpA-like peptidoglycan-associated protein
VKVEFENMGEKDASGKAILFRDIHLLDLDTSQKYFVLKDASGQYLAGPRSDSNDGGRWWVKVPAGGRTYLWAFFGPVPSGQPVVDVVIPEIFPFEGIEIGTGPFMDIDRHPTNAFPNAVELISARRSRGSVSIRLRLTNEGTAPATTGAVLYRDAYLYDYINQRKYPVLKDEADCYVAEPRSDANEGGRWWTSSLKPGGKQLMSLKFQSPPDSVNEVSLIVPLLVPFENVELAGTSGVNEHSGSEVLGAVVGLKRILENLQAEETEKEIKIQLSSEVLFDHDQSLIRQDAEPALSDVLTLIREYEESTLRIEGHTDATGGHQYNLNLSEKRANSVKDWLTAQGVSENRLTARGFGELRPVAANDTPEGRQQNRRVELIIEKPSG